MKNPLKQSTRKKSVGAFSNGSWKRSDRTIVSFKRIKKNIERIENLLMKIYPEKALFNV